MWPMVKLLNILILLGIISFGRYNFMKDDVEKAHIKQISPNRGPVYNPLRAKPYSKYTAIA